MKKNRASCELMVDLNMHEIKSMVQQKKVKPSFESVVDLQLGWKKVKPSCESVGELQLGFAKNKSSCESMDNLQLDFENRSGCESICDMQLVWQKWALLQVKG